MLKIIGSIGLLLTAAYCSYQIFSIRNWQKMLTHKQSQFGIQKSRNIAAIKQYQNWGTALASAFVLLIVVSPQQLGFQQDNMIRKSPGYAITNEIPSPESYNAVEKSTMIQDANNNAWGNSNANGFIFVQKNVAQIDTTIIEPVDDTVTAINHDQWMELLQESLTTSSLPMMQEQVIVKTTMKDSTKIILKLAFQEEACYLIDEEAQVMYLVQ